MIILFNSKRTPFGHLLSIRIMHLLLCAIILFFNHTLIAQNENKLNAAVESIFNKKDYAYQKNRFTSIHDTLKTFNDLKSEFSFLKITAEIAKERKEYLVEMLALNSLGILYNRNGKYQNAIQGFEEGLKISKTNLPDTLTSNLIIRSNIYMNLGNSFYYLQSPERELSSYKNSLAELEKIKTKSSEMKSRFALIYNNLGIGYSNLGDYETGIQYFNQAKALNIELNDSLRLANVDFNIAECYIQLNNNDKALQILKELRNYYLNVRMFEDVAQVNIQISNIYRFGNHNNQALTYALEGLTYSDTTTFSPENQTLYRALSSCYEINGNYKQALYYSKKRQQTADSLDIQNVLYQVKQSELQMQFNNLHITDSVTAANKIQLQGAKLEQRKKQNYFLISIISVVIAALLIIYNRLRIINKQKKIIEEKERITKIQNREISIQKKVIEEKQQELIESLHYAQRIQKAQMPSVKRMIALFERIKR
ncbi:MAG: tetratricopeptide repeat protein [Sphingobacteriaceae bacterium]|nr:tetratricopeptide repeat protein [Sphingobacteriaceae bacterium]